MLTPGKIKGLEAISDTRGVIAALAMDQRGSLEILLGKAGVPMVTDAMLEDFKVEVTQALSPYASAVLLDPRWGMPATRVRAPGCGLLLSYEKWGYDDSRPGRLPELEAHDSVLRLKERGAQAIKILLQYTPFEDPAINDIKHAWVERIGAECGAHDLPFLLEFVGYDPSGVESPTAYAHLKPDIVQGSIEEFSSPRYGVDVLKVEFPVDMRFVAETASCVGKCVYSRAEARTLFRRVADATPLPFIYLSAGVSSTVFLESLQLAVEAEIPFSGVLCGRATWQDGVPAFVAGGAPALGAWLRGEGTAIIQAINAQLQAARPWYSVYNVQSPEALNPQGLTRV